jgi:anti-sigma regulatory factor (Ser/Thr protein kinase)
VVWVCRQFERSLPCDAVAASAARRLCAEWLGETVGTSPAARDCLDVASLVISELVTNAVTAGCVDAVVMMDLHRHRVRVGVTDDGAGLPRVQHPSASEGHGRGLQIVERLSLAWGVSQVPEGKLVWADLSVPAELTTDLRCGVSITE